MDPSLERLYREHYSFLCATATHVLLDRDSAEDVVQDAFVRLSRRSGDTSLSYVRRVVINRAIDIARRRTLAERYLRRTRADVHRFDSYTDPDLMEALVALPPRQRACVVLRHLYDLSESQTADELGTSVGTVKSQTHKALATLRAALDDTVEEECTRT